MLAVGATLNADAATHASRRTPRLTSAGQTLWNFEALLKRTFGSHYHGCLRPLDRYTESFTKDSWCNATAMADHRGYAFTFANAFGGKFHRAHRTFPASAFGNYPQPIRIETDYVACDPAGRSYLISYGDLVGLSANLACIRPNG